MTLNCSNCDAEVPEGATECPQCGAGIGTVMLGKKRNLTKTLIGKAIELRNSIPWANPSQVVMLRDDEGHRRARPGGIAGVGAVLLVVVGVIWLAMRKPHSVEKKEAEAVAEETEKETKEAKAPPAPSKEEPPAKAATTDIPPPHPTIIPPPPPPMPATPKPDKKTGTLAITASYKGKAVAGAKVVVNGENKGVTPITVALPPSKYTLVIEKSGFKREKRSGVLIQAGRKATLKVAMQK